MCTYGGAEDGEVVELEAVDGAEPGPETCGEKADG